MSGVNDEIEQQTRSTWDGGDRDGAAALAVNGYGPELYNFVCDRVSTEADAQDVFSDFLENLWTSWDSFRWSCSVRTWCYVLLRRALVRHYRGAKVRRARNVPLSDVDRSSQLIASIRSRTQPFRRSEVKTRARELREQLPEEDQTLLVLRLEAGLSFSDLARVMNEGGDLEGAALTRESARLRKRFQIARDRLGKLLEDDGLINSDESP